MDAKLYLDGLIDAEIPPPSVVNRHRAGLEHWHRVRAERQGTQESATEQPDTTEAFYRQQTEMFNALVVPEVAAAACADYPSLTSLISSTPVGVLPVRSINGKVILTPFRDPIIVVDSGLIAMCSFYMESALYAPIRAHQSASSAELLLRTTYRFIAAYYRSDYDLEFPYPLEIRQDFATAATLFCLAIKAFVVAHEFAHICAGHIAHSAVGTLVLPSKTKLEEALLTKEQELEADVIAWRWYLAIAERLPFMSGLKNEYRIIAPLHLFVMMHCVHVSDDKHCSLDTHPAPRERLAQLIAFCDEPSAAKLALEILEQCDSIKSIESFGNADWVQIKNECEFSYGVALGTGRWRHTVLSNGRMPYRVPETTKRGGYYYERDQIAYALRQKLALILSSSPDRFLNEDSLLVDLGIDEFVWSSLMIELDDRFGVNCFWNINDEISTLFFPSISLGVIIDYLWRRVLLELGKNFPEPRPVDIIVAVMFSLSGDDHAQ